MDNEETDLKYDPEPEVLAESEKWLAERPPIIRELFTKCPPFNCYRSIDNRGHYAVMAYNENGTLRIAHGRDSYLPGVSVFGVKPDTLTPCGCRRWKFPTVEQTQKTGKRIDEIRREREA